MKLDRGEKSVSERFFTGVPWEKKVGYCRAIRRGNFIAISGTTAIKDGNVQGIDDPYLQTRRCLDIIEEVLKNFGVGREAIIRTRMFVADIKNWGEVGRAHEEFFRDFPPATSMVQVSSLIDPKLLVEIEADAIVTQE